MAEVTWIATDPVTDFIMVRTGYTEPRSWWRRRTYTVYLTSMGVLDPQGAFKTKAAALAAHRSLVASTEEYFAKVAGHR